MHVPASVPHRRAVRVRAATDADVSRVLEIGRTVFPDFQETLDHAVAELVARGAREIESFARETMPASVAFLVRRGFREIMRAWETRLDPTRLGTHLFHNVTEVQNIGMLAINDRLGFVPQPAWLAFEKTLSPENV